jgi:Holliday junction resolvasome RuvABC endonuclease subunit
MAHNSENYTLAVDPGTYTMGVAIFDNLTFTTSFTLKAPRKIKDADLRSYGLLTMLREQTHELLICAECGISHAMLTYENPQMFRIKGGLKSIEPVVRLSGMLSFWGLNLDMEVYRYPVSEIKTGIAGRNSASKESVERVMHRVLEIDDHNRTDHEYDAMSVAVYHLDRLNPNCFGVSLPMDQV